MAIRFFGLAFVGRSPVGVLTGVLLAVALALTACGGSGSVPADVSAIFDNDAQRVALIGDLSVEPVSEGELQGITARAAELGAVTRVVVVGEGLEPVDPAAVAEAYGGTVLSYKAGEPDFNAASQELDRGQLERAVEAAQASYGISDTARSFVSVLEAERVMTRSVGFGRIIMWILLGLAALFLLTQFLAYRRARRRSSSRRAEFEQRQASLQEWVGLLGEDARRLVGTRQLDADQKRLLDSTMSELGVARLSIQEAKSLADLDANEIRIARGASKLRLLRAEHE